MVVRSVRHRGLRRLIEEDNPRFLRQNLVDRLSGDRQAEWSVSVSGNWRITFKEEDSYIDRLNLEDYH